MKKFTRRSFIKQTAITTASISILPALRAAQNATATSQASAVARVAGANEEIRYAVVGFNGRGTAHLEGMRKAKGTRLVALCDVDRHILERETQKCKDLGEQVEPYTDIRKLLENKTIDTVTF